MSAIHVLALVVLALAATAVPRWHRQRLARRRRDATDAVLPDVVDLLIVMLGAGFEMLDAIRWLGERGPAPTSAAFRAVVEASERGQPLTVALRSIADELGPAYRSLAAALVSAVRDGASTSTLLLRLGDEGRTARRRRQDRSARSLPVQLLFPLVCCSLPAVVVGAVVPLALVAIGRL